LKDELLTFLLETSMEMPGEMIEIGKSQEDWLLHGAALLLVKRLHKQDWCL